MGTEKLGTASRKGHSDPTKLKETAQDVQRLSPSELKRRQLEIKELMEKIKMPSDAQLMQIAIDDLNNSSLPLEDHHRALQELLILVEPIDNAIVPMSFLFQGAKLVPIVAV
ncbi:unnamed protein product [Ilex paraguariensis]|uniref:Nucleotide exchange factor Fes1 domain-containing protein n=1 Tax=Ilex paraguariensis TaxID=185542 RepID=A0ABC8UB89_9AQUA